MVYYMLVWYYFCRTGSVLFLPMSFSAYQMQAKEIYMLLSCYYHNVRPSSVSYFLKNKYVARDVIVGTDTGTVCTLPCLLK